MKKENQQTPDNAFCEALHESIQGTRHAIKFIARFVEALLKTRTCNLMKIAQAIETEVEAESVYRQVQRYLKSENQVSIDYLKLLKLEGKLKILIDRTEWQFGATWVNILCVSVAYGQAAIPLMASVINRKGNARAEQHVALLRRLVRQFGAERIERVYGDREFGTQQLFEYLLAEKIDFHIRLKTSHRSSGISFAQRWKKVSERVKLRGKVKTEVFGLEVFVSCVKYQKNGQSEYLIVASREQSQNAVAEYKVRWQIETMFGCLKSRGFDFEETHLTEPRKIGRLLTLLGLGLCLAMMMGEFQVTVLKRVKIKIKKNGRYGKSLFRIGLDGLQNLLFNHHKRRKHEQLQLFIKLLSCA